MKKQIKVIGAVILAIIAVTFLFTAKQEVSAVVKPKLEDAGLIIPRGHSGVNIWINNKKEKATYTYKSSDTSIVQVSTDGELFGVKIGKANVTAYEKYKGKTTKVGTCKIQVAKAHVFNDEPLKIQYNNLLGTEEYTDYYYDLSAWQLIAYWNYDATYTYFSSDDTVIKVTKDGVIKYLGEPGSSATITVKETYKKKTSKIGTIDIVVATPYIDPEDLTVELNTEFYADECIYGTAYYDLLISNESDINRVDLSETIDLKDYDDRKAKDDVLIWDIADAGYWNGGLIANARGTVYLHYFYGKDADLDCYIGCKKVTVK